MVSLVRASAGWFGSRAVATWVADFSSGARAALYLRVNSTGQTTENQERELRRWSERLGLEVVRVYSDTASGARSDRAALAQVLAGAHRREFDALLIWSSTG